ncbi:MAG TPA: hypothetical protein VGI74_19295 [Streptosporangiaceae bacterium]
MRISKRITLAAATVTAGAAMSAAVAITPAVAQTHPSFIGKFHSNKALGSTVPADGDVNPYGVAVVRHSVGALKSGNVLVSNFNDKANVQGTGTTIVQVTPGGKMTQFARITPAGLPEACPGGIGLTTALDVLNGGWVVVGSLPTSHGGTVFTGSGCLVVLNSRGHVVETLTGHGINGPWDMAAVQSGPFAELFVTNVLNGTAAAGGQVTHHGTVVRLVLASSGGNPPGIVGSAQIGSGFAERTDPAALVIGPTGLGVGGNGTLFVADTLANRIAEIPGALWRSTDAGRGLTVTRNGALNNPLGLFVAPGGHILTVNSGDGKIVETSQAGIQVATHELDSSGSPPGSGALFGLAVMPGGAGVYYVDDATNTLNRLN